MKVDDEVFVDGWGDTRGRVVAITVHGDVVVEHPMGEFDTVPDGWVEPT